jgi:glutamate dehydrogenase (NAD(P)+)
MTGKTINAQKELLTKGAEEVDLVRSGLEETMINSYNHQRDLEAQKGVEDLRTAAFICALNKISSDYLAMGIFP